jgi:hypothetical protein
MCQIKVYSVYFCIKFDDLRLKEMTRLHTLVHINILTDKNLLGMIQFFLKIKKKSQVYRLFAKKNAVEIKVRINCVRHMLAGMYYNVVFTFGRLEIYVKDSGRVWELVLFCSP